MWNPFNIFLSKKIIGIDIGTSAIKVVEISRFGQGKRLENYGEIASNLIYKDSPERERDAGSIFSTDFVSSAIRTILDEAKIKTKSVVFSIPDFFTFCTSFEMPPMPENEIAGAIYYNASQYITLPISEVMLDWRILPNLSGKKDAPLKIFLIAVPNQIVEEYKTVARRAGLEIYAIESEIFGIARVFTQKVNKVICLVDIGVQTSTISIVDSGVLKKSYSFNFYSNQLSKSLSSALSIDTARAEEIKNKEGLISEKQGVGQTLRMLVQPLITEIQSVSAEFLQSDQKQVQEIYLTGGTANLPGLKDYIAENLKKNVVVPNCFSDFLYPPVLDESLREMSPRFSVAIGVALAGLEK